MEEDEEEDDEEEDEEEGGCCKDNEEETKSASGLAAHLEMLSWIPAKLRREEGIPSPLADDRTPL